MAFEALHHLLEYLYHHMHEPLFYLLQSFSPEEIITYSWSPLQQTKYSTFESLLMYSDSAFANILPHRQSMQSNVTTLNGVIIDWSCNKQTKVTVGSTNAEVTALYATCKKAIALRSFLTSGNFSTEFMKPIIISVDNKAAIGLLKSNKLIY